jgi:predicted component of type VI protein secretion system
MRGFLVAMTVVITLVGATGCAGIDPNAPISITVSAEESLNTYTEGGREGPHSLDLYVFKVDDPDAFLGNDAAKLRVASGDVVGGRSIGRFTIAPAADGIQLDLGKMRDERWTHLGVFAAFGAPTGTPDAQTRVLAIDSDGMTLTLGAREILTFTAD